MTMAERGPSKTSGQTNTADGACAVRTRTSPFLSGQQACRSRARGRQDRRLVVGHRIRPRHLVEQSGRHPRSAAGQLRRHVRVRPERRASATTRRRFAPRSRRRCAPDAASACSIACRRAPTARSIGSSRERRVVMDNGNAVRMFGTCRDVTERVKLHRELRMRASQQETVARLGERALTETDLQAFFDDTAVDHRGDPRRRVREDPRAGAGRRRVAAARGRRLEAGPGRPRACHRPVRGLAGRLHARGRRAGHRREPARPKHASRARRCCTIMASSAGLSCSDRRPRRPRLRRPRRAHRASGASSPSPTCRS